MAVGKGSFSPCHHFGMQVGELHALLVSESHLRWNSDDSGATLWPNAAFFPRGAGTLVSQPAYPACTCLTHPH